jgi:hypothetical protein
MMWGWVFADKYFCSSVVVRGGRVKMQLYRRVTFWALVCLAIASLAYLVLVGS